MWEIIGKFFVTLLFSAIGWSIVKGLYGSFIASALGLSINFKKTGKWAVVTGSTDGIGKAYAFEMARQGLNVVLISRTPFKLQNVSSEILSKYNVETKIIDVDFTKTDIYTRIEKEIAHLDIGVLINNVGMNYDVPEYFTDISADMISNLITCNMLSLTMMTKIVLPGMQERNRGLIINVSSLSSIIPAPFLAVYGATKVGREILGGIFGRIT
ncbi:UNVERIFIED_CONTAM: hypothetical protein GTU68_065217 [Idotea baltica]|nr:hypothetical protein [Idotea baltica]